MKKFLIISIILCITILINLNKNYSYVDVKGEVMNPGIYRISDNEIINDVIIKAGGLLPSADTSDLNLSKRVFDGDMIIVDKVKKEKSLVIEKEILCDMVNLNYNIININEANIDELMKLPSIGEAKAKAIIEYRNIKSFNKKEDIKNVKGIGDSIYEKIKDLIRV